MNFVHKLEDLSLNVSLENKSNIKHCYLRIISRNQIQIRANKYFSLKDAKSLIETKKDWIFKHITAFKEKTELNSNQFFYLGSIIDKEEKKIDSVEDYYKENIIHIIPNLVSKYSKIMELYPNALKYRKNKRTWGSCNYKDELNFNIYLCKFPLEVIEYIVIHELSHIKHKNHSKDFWLLVEKYCPDYKRREKLLKSFL